MRGQIASRAIGARRSQLLMCSSSTSLSSSTLGRMSLVGPTIVTEATASPVRLCTVDAMAGRSPI